MASPRFEMLSKIGRNFEVFTPCDFIAAITQHIPDKSFQLVHYYGWYSNKMRGRRAKQADEEVQTEGDAVEVIDVSAHEPRCIPFKIATNGFAGPSSETGDYQEIMNKASCLSLVSNAILAWNTLQIARILETLRQTGTAVAVEDLARVSPLLHRHVIPNGTYHFPRAIEGVNLS